MAKLTDENGFILDFELLQPDTSDPKHTYYPMRFTLLLNNEPVLNEKVLRRDCEYSCKGFPGGFAGEEIDNFSLIKDLEEVYKSKKMKLWSAFPHDDIEIAIYPGLFPYLDEENKEYFTLILSPCLCRFKDVNICGISPVSFIMTPSVKEYKQFIKDLRKEQFNIYHLSYNNIFPNEEMYGYKLLEYYIDFVHNFEIEADAPGDAKQAFEIAKKRGLKKKELWDKGIKIDTL